MHKVELCHHKSNSYIHTKINGGVSRIIYVQFTRYNFKKQAQGRCLNIYFFVDIKSYVVHYFKNANHTMRPFCICIFYN